jgi:hypothetical protein
MQHPAHLRGSVIDGCKELDSINNIRAIPVSTERCLVVYLNRYGASIHDRSAAVLCWKLYCRVSLFVEGSHGEALMQKDVKGLVVLSRLVFALACGISVCVHALVGAMVWREGG